MNNERPKIPEFIVGILIYRNDGKILLTRSAKWSNKWVAVGGHVEYGEVITNAATREIKEETDLDVEDLEFLGNQEIIFPKEFHRKAHFIVSLYCARSLGQKVILNDEASEYQWRDPNKLDDLDIFDPTQELINIYRKKHGKKNARL